MKLVLASLEFLVQPYDYRGLKVFCKSLREHYDGDCVFFTRNVPPQAMDILKENNITSIEKSEYEEKYNIVKFGINATRRLYNYLFLKNNPKYTDIISIDVTDVVIQSDPFKAKSDGKAQISEEAVLIKDCTINAGWISGNYGDKEFELIGNKPILCAGIIRANNENTQKLSKIFINEVQELFKRSRGTKFGNLDQAHIEYMFHSLDFDKEILPYVNDSYMHIGHTKRDDLSIDNGTITISSSLGNITPNIVHQYNRHADIEGILYEQYK